MESHKWLFFPLLFLIQFLIIFHLELSFPFHEYFDNFCNSFLQNHLHYDQNLWSFCMFLELPGKELIFLYYLISMLCNSLLIFQCNRQNKLLYQEHIQILELLGELFSYLEIEFLRNYWSQIHATIIFNFLDLGG